MKKLDAASVLQKLAAIRESMPRPSQPRPRKPSEDLQRMRMMPGATLQDFDRMAIAEALESMADELRQALDEKRAAMMVKAMEIYYTTEELSHDPEHANLIPHVEAMRAAYERDYGEPIPPRPKKKEE